MGQTKPVCVDGLFLVETKPSAFGKGLDIFEQP